MEVEATTVASTETPGPLASALWYVLEAYVEDGEARQLLLAEILLIIERIRPEPRVDARTVALVRSAYVGALANGGYRANAERIAKTIVDGLRAPSEENPEREAGREIVKETP